MADVITRTTLEHAEADVQSLALVINGASDEGGDGIVTTRLGRDIPTLARVISGLQGTDLEGTLASALSARITGSRWTFGAQPSRGIEAGDLPQMSASVMGVGTAAVLSVAWTALAAYGPTSAAVKIADTETTLAHGECLYVDLAQTPVGDVYAVTQSELSPTVAEELDDGYLLLAANVSGAIVGQLGAALASAALARSVGEQTIGRDPDVSNAAGVSASSYFIADSLSTTDAVLRQVEVAWSGAASAAILVASVGSGGALTLVSRTPISLVDGVNVIPCLVDVPAGCVVGIGAVPGIRYQSGSAGRTLWYCAGYPSTATAVSLSYSALALRITLSGRVVGGAETAFALRETMGETMDVGWGAPIVATGSTAPNPYSIVWSNALDEDVTVDTLTVGCSAPGTLTLCAMSLTADFHASVIRSTAFPVVAGVNTLSPAFRLSAGEHIGVIGTSIKYQAYANNGAVQHRSYNGAISADTLTVAGVHRFEIGVSVTSGLRGQVLALGDATDTAVVSSGIGLLAEADASGVEDATSLLAAARVAHAAPCIPAGTFAVTAVPVGGAGLWGAGHLKQGGDAFFLRPGPASTSLYDGLRAALLEHIAAGDVLTVIGDSISHWAHAETGPQHWFNLLLRFANLGAAAQDEPIMTALRPSSTYVPSFYGLTVSGGSTGTAGPIGESLILAAGDYLEFAGAYAQVDVFAQRASGAGTLAVSFGGTSYGSTSFSGAAANDVHSGFPATGQAAYGTYRITASGGPVEITGLVREGAATAASGTSRARLRGLRAAHGSYLLRSFSDARVASIMAQAEHWGGKCVPIIALGINDALNDPASTVVASAEALLARLESHSVPRIYAVTPMRPSASWDSVFNARRWESAIGGLLRVYREHGVHVLPTASLDWPAAGLCSDGLHPNVAGHRMFAQLVAEGISTA